MKLAAIVLAAAMFAVGPAFADCAGAPGRTGRAPDVPQEGKPLPPDVARAHQVALPGRCLEFHTTAGSVAVGEDVVAYVSYVLDGGDPLKRPVAFAINGGPGAGSVWLQLGALGPWRLPMDGLTPTTPPVLVENAETWLDFVDLVFLDPPGTGYARAKEGAKSDVWSVEGDNRVLAETIRRWLSDHARLASPKYIVGESYGGFRAPRLAKTLEADLGVGVNGVVLLSPVLDFGPFTPGLGNPFPYLTRLPSYAAAAREAKGPVSRADLADAEAYAKGEYLADWLAGPRDAAATARKVARVAALTGLAPEIVARYAGDIDEWDFLRERGRLLGRRLAFYDATLTAGPTAPDWPEAQDPVLPGFVPAMTSAMTALYREKLGWMVGDLYEALNGNVGHNWNWGRSLSPPQALGDLAQTLALDPDFRVLVAHGLTDVQAPYFASVLQLARLPAFAGPERLRLAVYPGGHMFYSRDDSRKAFREEARRLIEGQ